MIADKQAQIRFGLTSFRNCSILCASLTRARKHVSAPEFVRSPAPLTSRCIKKIQRQRSRERYCSYLTRAHRSSSVRTLGSNQVRVPLTCEMAWDGRATSKQATAKKEIPRHAEEEEDRGPLSSGIRLGA